MLYCFIFIIDGHDIRQVDKSTIREVRLTWCRDNTFRILCDELTGESPVCLYEREHKNIKQIVDKIVETNERDAAMLVPCCASNRHLFMGGSSASIRSHRDKQEEEKKPVESETTRNNTVGRNLASKNRQMSSGSLTSFDRLPPACADGFYGCSKCAATNGMSKEENKRVVGENSYEEGLPNNGFEHEIKFILDTALGPNDYRTFITSKKAISLI